MKGVNCLMLGVLVSSVLGQDNTGVDCSSSVSVCDRDSECCGTGTPFTTAENTAQTATTNIKVCNKKYRTEIQIGVNVYKFTCKSNANTIVASLAAGLAMSAAAINYL